MSEPPHDDFEEKLIRERIRQLRETLDGLTDGKAIFSEPAEDMPPEMELAFLERVLAFETAGRTTWLKRLEEKGYLMPPPESLTNDEIGLELWQVIQHLAELRVFLYNTDHLSDQELYRELYNNLLAQETLDLHLDEDSACHLDVVGSGTEEEVALWLTYYADDETRQDWIEQFPDYTLPPRQKPPYDRDRLLPKREGLETDPLKHILQRLYETDWEDPQGAIRLDDTLTHQELEAVPAYQSARALLELLRESGNVKATASRGNLPRSFNKTLYERLPPPPEEMRMTDRLRNDWNEPSLSRIHKSRLACQEAKLLHKHRGSFTLTRKGEALLTPEAAGKLYRALVIAFFRRVNLAYFDAVPELPDIQATVPITLWRLSLVARHWTDLDTLPEALLLPNVFERLEKSCTYLDPHSLLNIRLLRHLVDFGLLEALPYPPEVRKYEAQAYRITPMFQRFLSFHVEE